MIYQKKQTFEAKKEPIAKITSEQSQRIVYQKESDSASDYDQDSNRDSNRRDILYEKKKEFKKRSSTVN